MHTFLEQKSGHLLESYLFLFFFYIFIFSVFTGVFLSLRKYCQQQFIVELLNTKTEIKINKNINKNIEQKHIKLLKLQLK